MSPRRLEELLDAHGVQAVVNLMEPYVSESRRARIEAVLGSRLPSVALALEAPSDPHNAAATVRTAEALGAGAVHVVAAEGRALQASRTTQGAFHWIHTAHHRGLPEFLEAMGAGGFRLVGATVDGARLLDELDVDGPLCLVLGNEQRGLSAGARGALADTFRIPMFGMSESLNLSVSAAISLYEVTRRRRAYLGRAGDLEGEGRERWRARYMARGLDDRLLEGLVARFTG